MNYNALRKLRTQLNKTKYKCKESCFECCTAVPTTEEEIKLMTKELRRLGYDKPPNGKGDEYCEMLTPEGKCSVYDQRPIVCRSFSDKSYRLKKSGKPEVFTPTCTYWVRKIVEPTQEFIRYMLGVLDSGVVIGSTDMLKEKKPVTII